MIRVQHLLAMLLSNWSFLVAVDCLAVPGSNANNATTMPTAIVLTLKTKSQTITLNLTKNTNIPSEVPVVVAANGTQTTWKSNSDEFAAYREMNGSASIVIQMKAQNGKLIKICRGTLSINGRAYTIYPIEGNLQNLSSKQSLVAIDGIDHVMTEEDIAHLLTIDRIDSQIRLPGMVADVGILLDWPSGFQRYVVEMAIFIDYALYYRWYSRSQATLDHWGRRHEALQNIQYYFVQVANGVDTRYSTIASDFSINVRLVGIFIAETPSDSHWTMRSDVTASDGYAVYTDMYKALVLFENWLPTTIPKLGFTFDQATLFTGNKLYNGAMCSGVPCSTSGLSEVGTICHLGPTRALSVSINKDFGIYSSIQTAAHELGHNLGANHDGSGNACSGKDQYVMASVPNALSAVNFNNPFKFSSCSTAYFRSTLARLTMSGRGNCLLVGTTSPTVAVPRGFGLNPGQQYSPDQQCQQMYGLSSFYCAGGGSRDQKICQSMACWVPNKKLCEAGAEQRAYDGTQCGNKKWCTTGQCVHNGQASSAPDTCIYGDYKDRVSTFSVTKMSCYDMGRLEPNSCYLSHIAEDCCRTCANIRNERNSLGCPYGDKDPKRCQSVIAKMTYSCYEASFSEGCCESCNRVKSRSVGCEYGDSAEWCRTTGAHNCYSSGKTCCGTCQKFYDSRYPGCEFGDKAPWCNVLGLDECKTANNFEVCCRRCAAYRKTNPADQVCQDKASSCSSVVARDCYDHPTLLNCCSTCSRYLRTK